MTVGAAMVGRSRFRVISGGVDRSGGTSDPGGRREASDRDGDVLELLRKRDELTAEADRLARRAHAVVDRIVALNLVIESYRGQSVTEKPIVPIAGNGGNLP